MLMGFRPLPAEWSQPEAGVYLVTGGAGFIGTQLVSRLAADGFRVRVLDDLSSGRRPSPGRAPGIVEFVEGDVRDPSVCREACRGAVVVFHLAGQVSTEESLRDPGGTAETNVGGTINMLEGAQAEGVRRFVLASSASVYGDSPVLPKEESMAELPESPLAASKVAAEKYCVAYGRRYGLSAMILRLFNVYGPISGSASAAGGLIPSVIRSIREGKAPVIHGEGYQTRDFVHADDVVEAFLLAAWTTEVSGDQFNIGSGGRVSVRDVVGMLGKMMKSSQRPVFVPQRGVDARDSQASIQKARRVLGYRPAIDLEAGLAMTVESFS
jgi:nucleoside-diphosphate-sugar epimerase